jgi:hypothetical protein
MITCSRSCGVFCGDARKYGAVVQSESRKTPARRLCLTGGKGSGSAARACSCSACSCFTAARADIGLRVSLKRLHGRCVAPRLFCGAGLNAGRMRRAISRNWWMKVLRKPHCLSSSRNVSTGLGGPPVCSAPCDLRSGPCRGVPLDPRLSIVPAVCSVRDRGFSPVGALAAA